MYWHSDYVKFLSTANKCWNSTSPIIVKIATKYDKIPSELWDKGHGLKNTFPSTRKTVEIKEE